MRKTRLAGLCAAMLVAACATGAAAADENVTTKKVLIKDNEDTTKRQIFAQSADLQITYSDAADPASTGASIHVWSESDDFCYVLTASSELWQDTGKAWKYKNPDTKNQATIQDKKLSFKLKSDVGFSLADDEPQGTVNVAVQFGATGSRFCMTCTTPTKDVEFQYQAKECTAGSCAMEPASCDPVPTTTTTTTTTTTLGIAVGALPKTDGGFNYGGTPGVPGAEVACNTNYPGAFACSYQNLVTAQGNGSLVGLKDTAMVTPTRLWAIDGARPANAQCVNVAGTVRWSYATAHTGAGGDYVTVDTVAGTIGPLSGGAFSNTCVGAANESWVACCK